MVVLSGIWVLVDIWSGWKVGVCIRKKPANWVEIQVGLNGWDTWEIWV